MKTRAPRAARTAVPGSRPAMSNLIPRVIGVGNKKKPVNGFPGARTPNPRPPGNPTGNGTVTG